MRVLFLVLLFSTSALADVTFGPGAGSATVNPAGAGSAMVGALVLTTDAGETLTTDAGQILVGN